MRSWAAIVSEYECARHFFSSRSSVIVRVNKTLVHSAKHQRRWSSSSSSSSSSSFSRRPERKKEPLDNLRARITPPPPPPQSAASFTSSPSLSSHKLTNLLRSYLTKGTSKSSVLGSHKDHVDGQIKHETEAINEMQTLHLINSLGSTTPTITYFNNNNNNSSNNSSSSNEKIFNEYIQELEQEEEEEWLDKDDYFRLKEHFEEEYQGSEWKLHKDAYSKKSFFDENESNVNVEEEEENKYEHSNKSKSLEEWSEERVGRTLNIFENIIQVQMQQQRQDRQRQRELWRQRSIQEQFGFTRNYALHSVKQIKLSSEERELLQELLDYLISGNLPFVRRGTWGSAGCRIAWETGEYSRCCELYFHLRPLCLNYNFFKWPLHFELIIAAAGGSLKYSWLMQCWDVVRNYANGGVEENVEQSKMQKWKPQHELEEENREQEGHKEEWEEKMKMLEEVESQSIIEETKLDNMHFSPVPSEKVHEANCVHQNIANDNNLTVASWLHENKITHTFSYCPESPIAVPLTVRLYMICIFYLYHYVGIDFTLLPSGKTPFSSSSSYLFCTTNTSKTTKDKHVKNNASLMTIAHDAKSKEFYEEDNQSTDHVCEVYKLALMCLKKCLPVTEMCKNREYESMKKKKRKGNDRKDENSESSATHKSGSTKIVLLRSSNKKYKIEADKKMMFLSRRKNAKSKNKKLVNNHVCNSKNKRDNKWLASESDKSDLEAFVIHSLRKFHYKVYDVINDTYNPDNSGNNETVSNNSDKDKDSNNTITINQRRKELCIHSTEVDAGFVSIWEQFIAKWNESQFLYHQEDQQQEKKAWTNISTSEHNCCYHCCYNWWQNVWLLHSLMRRLLYTNYVIEANHIMMYVDLYFIEHFGKNNVNPIHKGNSRTIFTNDISTNVETENNNHGTLVTRPDILESEQQEKLQHSWEREQQVECDVENALVISLTQIWERQAMYDDNNTNNDNNSSNTSLLWLKRWLTQNFDCSINALNQMQNKWSETIKYLQNNRNSELNGKLYNDLLAHVAQCAARSNDVETIMFCLQEMLHNGYAEYTPSPYNAANRQDYSQSKSQEQEVALQESQVTISLSPPEIKEMSELNAPERTYHLTCNSMPTSPTSRHLKTCLHALVKCHYSEWINVYEVLQEHQLLSLHDEEFLYWQLCHISRSVKCKRMLNALLQRSLPIYGVDYSNRSLSNSSLSSLLPQQQEQQQYHQKETAPSSIDAPFSIPSVESSAQVHSSAVELNSSSDWFTNHPTCTPDKWMTTAGEVYGEFLCSESQDNVNVEHRPFFTENSQHQTHLLTPRCVELLLELLIRCHHSALLLYYRYFVTHAGHKCGLSSRAKWLEMILRYWHTTWPSCPFYMENVNTRIQNAKHKADWEKQEQQQKSNNFMKTYAKENEQKSTLISHFNYTCNALEDHFLFIMLELIKVLDESNTFTKTGNEVKATYKSERFNSVTTCTNHSLRNCTDIRSTEPNYKSSYSSSSSTDNLHYSSWLKSNGDVLDTLTVILTHVKVLCIQYGHSNLEHWLIINTSPVHAKREVHALFSELRKAGNWGKNVQSTCKLLNTQWLDQRKNVRRFIIAEEGKIQAVDLFRHVTDTQNLRYGTLPHLQEVFTYNYNMQSSKMSNYTSSNSTYRQTITSDNVWLPMRNRLHATATRLN